MVLLDYISQNKINIHGLITTQINDQINKLMGKKGQLFFIEEFQLININHKVLGWPKFHLIFPPVLR